MKLQKTDKLGHARGFTLIEFLVVIAIIGILAATVLASLNTARTKGNDAAVKSNLTGGRAAAELFYDNASTYASVCANATFVQQINAAKAASGIVSATAQDAAGAAGTATCNDAPASGTGYAVEVPLKSAGYFCIDSVGKATTTATTNLSAANDVTCL